MRAHSGASASIPTCDEATERLITDYLQAFSAANPDSAQPVIRYRAGWFRFGSQGVRTAYRRRDVNEMIERLKARTAPSDTQPGTQPGLPGEVKQSNQEKSE